MTFKFGQRSKRNLGQCHADLQKIANELIKLGNYTVLCGHRNEHDQNEAFKHGYSKLKFPHSKHNKLPSLAMDICPYNNGVDWKDLAAFDLMCDRVEEIAKRLNIKIRLGRDFRFRDYPHIELV
jgi:peptidoglycan LD-endopeptidase CwlK